MAHIRNLNVLVLASTVRKLTGLKKPRPRPNRDQFAVPKGSRPRPHNPEA